MEGEEEEDEGTFEEGTLDDDDDGEETLEEEGGERVCGGCFVGRRGERRLFERTHFVSVFFVQPPRPPREAEGGGGLLRRASAAPFSFRSLPPMRVGDTHSRSLARSQPTPSRPPTPS